VDVDALIAENLRDVTHWEENFRLLKTKGRELEKLPAEIKVDCVTVSCLPVKATIDDQVQQLFDSLVSALRKSLAHDSAAIDSFVEAGMEALTARPQTVAEIGRVNATHARLSADRPVMQQHFAAIETKNRLLRQVAGAAVDVAALVARWDKFDLMLDSHALMIKEQVGL
jgi:dynein heavy chain 2